MKKEINNRKVEVNNGVNCIALLLFCDNIRLWFVIFMTTMMAHWNFQFLNDPRLMAWKVKSRLHVLLLLFPFHVLSRFFLNFFNFHFFNLCRVINDEFCFHAFLMIARDQPPTFFNLEFFILFFDTRCDAMI